MTIKEKQINEILEEIKTLPSGKATFKKHRDTSQMYLQWTENGRQQQKYIKRSDESLILNQIKRREELEKKLNSLMLNESFATEEEFLTSVKTGEELLAATSRYSKFGKRDCFKILEKYLNSDELGKVCLIYGLRRTGKTTMLLQAINELPINQTAYIKVLTTDSMADLNKDLKKLSSLNYKYVFIDEVTLLKDFIGSASLFSDVYSNFGMKIVLSGTDSLGLFMTTYDELYNRAITIHTTFIPFKEYSRLLNIHDVDEYIRYGGTFVIESNEFDNADYNEENTTFLNEETTRKYIDTAIAKNIQHSLTYYKDGSYFRHLIDLYDKGELTNAINRIIENMNHYFIKSVLTKTFESHDLGSARQIDRKRKALVNEIGILDEIDLAPVTQKLMSILEIKDQDSQSILITDEHIEEIIEYLSLLDLIVENPIKVIGTKEPLKGYLFTQPGMRYAQAEALIYSLMKNDEFNTYSITQRKEIEELILNDIKGRMMEEIVLLETIKYLPKNKKAFKVKFASGEFDMVIQDTDNLTCEVYEIKHSKAIDDNQIKFLIQEDMLNKIEFNYGAVIKKGVIYRGDNTIYNNIEYINVEDYLTRL